MKNRMEMKEKVLRVIAATIVLILIFWGQKLYQKQSYKVESFSGLTMGTSYHVKIATNEALDLERVKGEVEAVLEKVNSEMSTYIGDSEISRFNNFKSKEPFSVSKGFLYVIEEAQRVYKVTDGLFDPTLSPLINLWGFGEEGSKKEPPEEKKIQKALSIVGMDKIELLKKESSLRKKVKNLSINLSAIAKGYGVDALVKHLKKYSPHLLVEIGGEVMGTGLKNPYKKLYWRVGVEKPNYDDESDVLKTKELKDQCIASSGDYRNFFKFQGKRFSHTIDPRTGRPMSSNVVASSVFAENCTVADALATSLMLGGKKLITKLKASYHISGFILVSTNGKLEEIKF